MRIKFKGVIFFVILVFIFGLFSCSKKVSDSSSKLSETKKESLIFKVNDDDNFVFVVMGDNRPERGEIKMPSVFKKILKKIASDKEVKFVIMTVSYTHLTLPTN